MILHIHTLHPTYDQLPNTILTQKPRSARLRFSQRLQPHICRSRVKTFRSAALELLWQHRLDPAHGGSPRAGGGEMGKAGTAALRAPATHVLDYHEHQRTKERYRACGHGTKACTVARRYSSLSAPPLHLCGTAATPTCHQINGPGAFVSRDRFRHW